MINRLFIAIFLSCFFLIGYGEEPDFYVDDSGYLCFKNPAENISADCINMEQFDFSHDYYGHPVILVWEKFNWIKPLIVDENTLVDEQVNQVAIRCKPMMQDAIVRAAFYYSGANQGSYNYEKSEWSFQSEAPGTLQNGLNNFVCDGGMMKVYAKMNGVATS
jgi:hypothetical protein